MRLNNTKGRETARHGTGKGREVSTFPGRRTGGDRDSTRASGA
jgi:hypothetical protein